MIAGLFRPSAQVSVAFRDSVVLDTWLTEERVLNRNLERFVWDLAHIDDFALTDEEPAIANLVYEALALLTEVTEELDQDLDELTDAVNQRMWDILQEKTGLKKGSILSSSGQGESSDMFVLNNISLNNERADSRLILQGPSTPPKRRDWGQTLPIEDLDELWFHNPDRNTVPNPAVLEYTHTPESAIIEGLDSDHPLFKGYNKYYGFARELVSINQMSAADIAQQMFGRTTPDKVKVRLHLEKTSKGTLALEFWCDHQGTNDRLQVDRIFGYYRPNRLIAMQDIGCLVQAYDQPLWRHWKRTALQHAQCKEMWEYLTQYAVEVFANFVDKIASFAEIVSNPITLARSTLRNEESSFLCLTQKASASLGPKASQWDDNPSKIEAATGFNEKTLLSGLVRFDWENPTEKEQAYFSKMILEAGGNNLANYPNWLEEALIFYTKHDYGAHEKARKDAADKAVALRSLKIEKAKELLKTWDYGHKRGWGRAFSEEIGIRNNIKDWILRNLPIEAAVMYGKNERSLTSSV